MTEPITHFSKSNGYFWLSNFAPSHIEFVTSGYTVSFPTVENAYQAHKCPKRELEFSTISAREAKQLGQLVPLRAGWDGIKNSVMYECVRRKFKIPELRQQLLDTGDAILMEGNNWNDTWFGVCNGVGHNYLGRILMAIRSLIRAELEVSRIESIIQKIRDNAY